MKASPHEFSWLATRDSKLHGVPAFASTGLGCGGTSRRWGRPSKVNDAKKDHAATLASFDFQSKKTARRKSATP
jgi:hypothetical protein